LDLTPAICYQRAPVFFSSSAAKVKSTPGFSSARSYGHRAALARSLIC
jgi:hypothetical protein